jgi:glycine cleavage system protein P-like pyridoxal-binding family
LLATTNLNIQSSRNKLQSTSSILTTNLTQLTTQTPTELNDLSESTNILQKNQQLTNQQLALQKAENTLNSLTRKYNQLQSELQLKIDIKQNQVESQKLMAQITKKTY